MITLNQTAKFKRMTNRNKKKHLQKMITSWVQKALASEGLTVCNATSFSRRKVDFAVATIESDLIKIKFFDEV
jgi:hypothetical protein